MAEPTYEELKQQLQIADEKVEAAKHKAVAAVQETPIVQEHLRTILNVLRVGRLLRGMIETINIAACGSLLMAITDVPNDSLSFIVEATSNPAEQRAEIVPENSIELRKHFQVVLSVLRTRRIELCPLPSAGKPLFREITCPLPQSWQEWLTERKVPGSWEEAVKEQEHFNCVLDVLTKHEILLSLPKETILFMLKHDPDPSEAVYRQMKPKDDEVSGLRWMKTRTKEYLALLSQLPQKGASLAIELATECAASEMEHYARLTSKENFRTLDYFVLAVVCREFSQGPKLDVGTYYERMHEYMDTIRGEHFDRACSEMKYLIRDLQEESKQRYNPQLEQRRFEAEELLREADPEAAMGKLWFPMTLRYLYGMRRKQVASFLVPRIAGHVLPMELQDEISAVYYDADFILRAPAIAQKNGPVIRESENELEAA
ncbi:hypothetical protein CERZMDRAFT_83457 [Cercospora zeae-maydis SCOH1-5]|uniref:Uncharacterized protein n=1 Tax=Cercospora zeae-maydis SCOH1-5 TaxID=717836 RepID=A0A6A6FKU2_9PEZI|nr:hypothetical protein CERZMDRAFT_83457 [Cercospora zeae-maydis SCOH1-5]